MAGFFVPFIYGSNASIVLYFADKSAHGVLLNFHNLTVGKCFLSRERGVVLLRRNTAALLEKTMNVIDHPPSCQGGQQVRR
ncbi:hypothetical protein BCT30_11320 [Enterovibrio norvegicus]|nr:hypothetical protein A1OS_11440 [Enterovibrio norvegicus]OEF54843.1 hypothetical protein A1OU_20785 [Enterovibrio norvegicus]PMI34002.1 hypothetical protein BCU47_01140 [Enterovibrio norvegicus]PMI36044.1 hypothetical protein BCU46_15995 [Enterovibrio norvegicus]PMN53648.1 hypothetical protein BCT30_11320 [Enterovibrio norvegicus]